MSNPNGQRGAKAERDLVVWLRGNVFPDACRARGEGRKDRGDIGGIPGVCVQVKNALREAYVMDRLRAGQAGALKQAGGRLPVAVVRLPGVTDPGKWWAAAPAHDSGLSTVVLDCPINPPIVPESCYRYHLSFHVEDFGWVRRGGWLVSTCDRLFGALR